MFSSIYLPGGRVQQTESKDAIQHGGGILRPSLGVQVNDGLPVALRVVLEVKLLLQLLLQHQIS